MLSKSCAGVQGTSVYSGSRALLKSDYCKKSSIDIYSIPVEN